MIFLKRKVASVALAWMFSIDHDSGWWFRVCSRCGHQCPQESAARIPTFQYRGSQWLLAYALLRSQAHWADTYFSFGLYSETSIISAETLLVTCKTRVWGGLGQLPLFVFHAIPPVPLAREAFFPPKSKCSCQSNLGGLSWPPRTATWTSLWSSSSQRPVCYSGSGTVTQRTSCSDTSNVAQPFTLLIPFLCLLLHIYWVDFDTPVMYYLYFLLLMIRIC